MSVDSLRLEFDFTLGAGVRQLAQLLSVVKTQAVDALAAKAFSLIPEV